MATLMVPPQPQAREPEEARLPAAATLAGLPAVWPHSLLEAIAAALHARPSVVVVLDDDPTGTQTVHGVAVLTTWEVADLTAEMARSDCFFVLTNSRSLVPAAATALAHQIGTNLRMAGRQCGRTLSVISRSDSTLRGHFPTEVDALVAGLEPEAGPVPLATEEPAPAAGFDAVVVAPWFLAGGRVTLHGVHYAHQGDELVPVGRTEFATDASFGYRNSQLARWIEEKTEGATRAGEVTVIELETLRVGGPQAVTQILLDRPPGGYIVFDAVDERDVEVVVAGLLAAEAGGRRYLARSAASFVRVRAAISAQALLAPADLLAADPTPSAAGPAPSTASKGRLLVVGSHVARTTEQLQAVLALATVEAVELRVDAARVDARAEGSRCGDQVEAALAAGRDVVLYTERTHQVGADGAESLAISVQVSAALVQAVGRLHTQPRFLVAKGGITASDIATKGLGLRRAEVLGQIQPGVAVWACGPESRFPGLRYVVFPGNVGQANSLAELLAPDSER